MEKFSAIFLLLIASAVHCESGKHFKRVDDVKCDAQMKFFSESLANRALWALELFDSWTKFQSGISFGNAVDFGNFEQCLDFKHDSDDSEIGSIQGQHCMVFYQATSNASTKTGDGNLFDWTEIGTVLRARQLRLGAGVCLPSSCSSSKIQLFVKNFLIDADLQLTTDYNQAEWCVTSESEPYQTIDIVCVVVLSILGLLLALSTTYELLMIRSNHKPHELYSAFSVYKNGAKLFHIDRGGSNMLLCLSGMRTFAMLHIMLGHRFSWSRGFPNVNAKVFATDGKWMGTLFSAFVAIHPIAVDSFFVMGGLLVARSALQHIERGTFNIPKMYLHRYLRTIPVLGILILIIVSILKFFGSGPYFNFVSNAALISQCEKNWWGALLHIQNYFDPMNTVMMIRKVFSFSLILLFSVSQCLQASWYLSADFQLVLISPLIIYPAYKWGWKFLCLLPAYIVGTEIWLFVISYQGEYKAARLLMPYDVGIESAIRTYCPTHIRMGPWLIGVMLGYIFFQTRNRKIVINKYVNGAMWALSISVIVSVLVGMLPLQSPDNPASQVANSLWFALYRNSWGYAIAWIILACQTGTGGVFKWFLELPVWQPLGRMSLSFYLVHSVYQTVFIGSGKVPLHFNMKSLLHNYAGDFIVSVFLASILYLTLEEPILLIENYIYKQLAVRARKASN